MPSNQKQDGEHKEVAADKSQIAPPSLSLPKGGGAIRGIGEKFAANPVTGTGSMTVPIATSPGRSGFGPQLALAYDSGSGNGPFGFGWSLPLPAITRKTDKGLPQYRDLEESDVFILSGAEDLVPLLKQDNQGNWVRDEFERDGYQVKRYRPRIEGLFARLERWTDGETGETHWRSISKDNITTLYGQTNNSRIFDPNDPNPEHPTRIFSWLICASYDDKGNAIIYEYAAENDDKVKLEQANECNRVRTANRYLKRIKYGNRTPNRDENWRAFDPTQLADETWMFEVVFDYGEGHYSEDEPDAEERVFAQAQIDPPAGSPWPVRQDPFSTYRAGFEVRTYRLCRRVLVFHHFPQELDITDCLVRSTEFVYDESQIASFITGVIQSGYVRQPVTGQPNRYLKKSLPPVEFEYSQVPSPEELARQPIREIDAESLENLPAGLDGAGYQWLDLDGEGASGILTEQAGGWYYKRNLSANNQVREDGHEVTVARFGPIERVARKPADRLADGAQFLDLAGDGQVDLVRMEGPLRGFYERTEEDNWAPFQPFVSWPDVNTHAPNTRFVDLTGDGHADILITEGEALTWYPSLAEAGFGPALRLSLPLDEEQAPRLVFADGLQSIYLADLSGDGLSDLVRIRNGEVCYWPNLGYGYFGAKVTMDHAPWFDAPDQFDQRRIRLADIDGSGTTDIFYLRRDGVQVYFNQSGNRWSDPVALPQFPPGDNISSVNALDLLGNGTACLVWSSPLPGAAGRPMRYLALMDDKPHLLVGIKNNLGAETKIQYAPSTKFYLDDKAAGKPWVTKLPFPVHVVERVEIYDHISRNAFVTRYTYHHGYFDGFEREFRGFGMVEQLDTEEFAALTEGGTLPEATNLDAASNVPPVLTKTWFHAGAFMDRNHISNFFAGLLDEYDTGEYYREPGMTGDQAGDAQAGSLLLPDTVLPVGLTPDEEREACRALKGAMLRQEVYALDGTDKAPHPYTVAEQNLTIVSVQPRGDNRHAVFLTHPREAITYHYERNPADPRLQHALTLEVDKFGNVLKSAAIGYGRRQPDADLSDLDQARQTQTLITYTENRVTNAIDDAAHPDDYHAPLPCDTRTYELTGVKPENDAARFSFDEWTRNGFTLPASAPEIPYEQTSNNTSPQKRLIEQVWTVYRKDDLTALLPPGALDPLALPGESYKLAFTPGLLAQVYQRPLANRQPGEPSENLLPDLAAVLPVDGPGGQAVDRGGYVDLAGDGHWWIPAGRVFFSPGPADTPADELDFARDHFFLPHRYRDPFHTTAVSTESFVSFDDHKLLLVETRDALGNIAHAQNNYRVLAPQLLTDPNGNRSEVAFDALGMVAGSAVMGKEHEPDGQPKGDSLANFVPDPTLADLNEFIAQPRRPSANPAESEVTDIVRDLLQDATTRIVYDLQRFYRSQQAHPTDPTQWEAPYAAILARETHTSDPLPSQGLKIQISFSYSDGFGREIQKKIQAEPGPVPRRDANGQIIVGPDGQPVMMADPVSSRWVGSGWTVFNNKGKPVRQYEPFFTDTHHFEFDVRIGVSPVLFYDPVERVVATLHPNHTWEKVVFDPWRQETWDVNDTVLVADPSSDAGMGDFFRLLPEADYLPTWYARRQDGTLGAQEQDAARKAAIHAGTPAIAHFDTLGRPFLTIAHNKFKREKPDGTVEIIEEKYPTRVELDIEGNQRTVRDAIVQNGDQQGRVVMRYDYDMLGHRIHQASMEAGERWLLNDVAGKPLYAWDSRDHQFRTAYDPLRRPTDSFLREGGNNEIVIGRSVYGESRANPEIDNLRGKVVELRDQAGIVASEPYDFKGNLLRSQRQLVQDYKNTIDWLQAPALENEVFTSSTTYDALNRPVTLTTPDSSVVHPSYNEANLLERLDVNLRGAQSLTPFVTNIDYNAKGQRELIEYGNSVSTLYEYDRETFRLIHLQTMRTSDHTALQDLTYTFDPVGNITQIQDDAQQTIYFNNQVVTASADYIYDAIYRLIEATGREHLGQAGGAPIPHSYSDARRSGIVASGTGNGFHPNAGDQMGRYCETYLYDQVGNFIEMRHHQACPGVLSWTRSYAYNEPSLLEPSKMSNRLSSTQVGNGTTAAPEQYTYDAHGNMLHMPQLQVMQWDYRDELQMTQRQAVNDADVDGQQHQGERTYYVYDAGGQRVRKVTEGQAAAGQTPTRKQERIYLGGFEIYRKYNGSGTSVTLERETLHVMDDKQRIALVETRTQGSDDSLPQLIRFQHSNHLGSASLELDDQAQIISYEEYYPYGSTSYQAVRDQTETPKRYRYTSMERDEESGLNYHTARYYAPWLGRWGSCDPIGITKSLDLYCYAASNPTRLLDLQGTNPDNPELYVTPWFSHSLSEDTYPIDDDLRTTEIKASSKALRHVVEYFLPPDEKQTPFEKSIPKMFISYDNTYDKFRIIQTVGGDENVTVGYEFYQSNISTIYDRNGHVVAITGHERGLEPSVLGDILASAGLMGLGGLAAGRIFGRETLSLVHLTSAEGKAGIEAFPWEINGKYGIFAVPDSAAGQGILRRVVRTGLPASKATDVVYIPSGLSGFFRRVLPIGPYSAWKFLGGVRFAAPGSLSAEGLSFSGSILRPYALIYGPDLLTWGLIGGAHLLPQNDPSSRKAISSAPQPGHWSKIPTLEENARDTNLFHYLWRQDHPLVQTSYGSWK